MNIDTLDQRLLRTIKSLNSALWEDLASESSIDAWLANFSQDPSAAEGRRLNLLFLLSNFLYFNNHLVKQMLKALYRDLYKYPLVQQVRRENGDSTDPDTIAAAFRNQQNKTRFLGIGNPSESGAHLLYYFRQENHLPKDLFIHTHEVFTRNNAARKPELRNPSIERYIFIDDFSGTGKQGTEYAEEIIPELRKAGKKVEYLVLVGTKDGLRKIREAPIPFDRVACVYELDDSFKVFNADSRYFRSCPEEIDRVFLEKLCHSYGQKLVPAHPVGYGGCQLLLGFGHNTPDNTLPVIWHSGLAEPWSPIFPRYPKNYGDA